MNVLSIDLDFLTENLIDTEEKKDYIIKSPIKFNIIAFLTPTESVATASELTNSSKSVYIVYNFSLKIYKPINPKRKSPIL